MAFSSLGAGGNENHSLLTRSVELFHANEFSEELRIFTLNTKEFVNWALELNTSSSQQLVDVLKRKTQS